MREEEMVTLLIMFSVSVTINVGLGIALFRSWKRNRRLDREVVGTYELEERTVKLEQTIDALAAQIDQLTNGQEFLNRVILRKSEVRELPRENTPH